MEKINGEHLERGLYDFLQNTSPEEVSYKGVLDRSKLKEALYDFLNAEFKGKQRSMLIVADSKEEAQEKFDKLLENLDED